MIGKRIKTLREQQNISQSELAKRLHTSRSSINAWENETQSPSIKHVIGLAKIFNVTCDNIIDNNQETDLIVLNDLDQRQKEFIREIVDHLKTGNLIIKDTYKKSDE